MYLASCSVSLCPGILSLWKPIPGDVSGIWCFRPWPLPFPGRKHQIPELRQDYVYTAQSRGNSRTAILMRHVLRNALIPAITFLAVSMAEILTGSIIIEQVFTIPGIGRLLLASISNRDFPVVQAVVVILAAWIVVVNFLADLLNQWTDPRVRLR